MKKDPTESHVLTVLRDDGVRRACADFLVAMVGAFIGKPSQDTTPKD